MKELPQFRKHLGTRTQSGWVFKGHWEVSSAIGPCSDHNKGLKSTGKLIWLDDTFKRKSFKEGTREALEAHSVSSAFSSSIFWNLHWIILLLCDWMRSYCLQRWSILAIVSYNSAQRWVVFWSTWAHSAAVTTRSHLWWVNCTHSRHLSDSLSTWQVKSHETHSLHDHILSEPRSNAWMSLQWWTDELEDCWICCGGIAGEKFEDKLMKRRSSVKHKLSMALDIQHNLYIWVCSQWLQRVLWASCMNACNDCREHCNHPR